MHSTSAPPLLARFPLAELPVGGRRLVRAGSLRLVVLRPAEGELHALDDRCPHEGYPLSQGTIAGGVLTCPWHNFKFRLATGACVQGDEAVDRYEVDVSAGVVEVRGRAEPTEATLRARAESLEGAIVDRRIGQAIRDAARLLKAGAPPIEPIVRAARLDAERSEYGPTHTLAVAADLGAELHHLEGADRLLALGSLFELASESVVRRPARDWPAPVEPGSPDEGRERFRAAVEREDAEAAIALVRGGLARGFGRRELEPWLLVAASDHFLSFGHGLIYATKVFDLIERVGPGVAEPLLGGLTLGLVNATREDLLPDWRSFRRRMAEIEPVLRRVELASAGEVSPGLVGLVLDGRLEAVFAGLVGALEGGASPSAIAGAIAEAAALRILRFDEAIDRRADVDEGWLDVTHLLTFAHATRLAVERHPSPETLRLLFQAARFVNHARPLDGPIDERPPRAGDSVLAAIARDEPEAALAIAREELGTPEAIAALEGPLLRLCFGDRRTRPIIVAHLFKTTRAAFAEHRRTGSITPLLAAIRLLASRPRERFLEQMVSEAIGLIEHGRPPRRLT